MINGSNPRTVLNSRGQFSSSGPAEPSPWSLRIFSISSLAWKLRDGVKSQINLWHFGHSTFRFVLRQYLPWFEMQLAQKEWPHRTLVFMRASVVTRRTVTSSTNVWGSLMMFSQIGQVLRAWAEFRMRLRSFSALSNNVPAFFAKNEAMFTQIIYQTNFDALIGPLKLDCKRLFSTERRGLIETSAMSLCDGNRTMYLF